MAMVPRSLLCVSRNGRRLSPYLHRWTSVSSEPLPKPPPDGTVVYSDKIQRLVEDISHLTLREVSQLNDLLKSTLNIPDTVPMMGGGVPGMFPGAASAGTAQDEDAGPKVEEQTEFTVNLTKFDEGSKVKLIKEVKTLMEGMNLVQAKKFVEGVPQVVKKDISKEEAEKLKAALEAAGGAVTIE